MNGGAPIQDPPALLQVERLTKSFPGRRNLLGRGSGIAPLRAVDDVSFEVAKGETFGIVGESGSGKSTIARCIVRLANADSGRILFDGTDLLTLPREELRRLRRRMQIVVQDPSSALDPRMSVRAIVEEPLVIHRVADPVERRSKVLDMLELVGLTRVQAERKPHEFSGGQRQRIALARALVLSPDLVILDEPISALDVSVQAQVLNLLRQLQTELQLTYIFIVHDLAVAEYFCDRTAVVYRGAVMEMAESKQLFRERLHPYTEALLAAAPIPDPAARRERRIILREEAATIRTAEGCRFRPQCFVGRDRDLCAALEPTLEQSVPGHFVACHFAGLLEDER
ncbi:MAG: hypothetical protein QOJ43_1789 [Gaiellaceae bacterium]|jgi:oligopeptide/dipeptide ABC transporter ATP-binding protein|nr:hypothetical protein [Gaiellaceae bacterium]